MYEKLVSVCFQNFQQIWMKWNFIIQKLWLLCQQRKFKPFSIKVFSFSRIFATFYTFVMTTISVFFMKKLKQKNTRSFFIRASETDALIWTWKGLECHYVKQADYENRHYATHILKSALHFNSGWMCRDSQRTKKPLSAMLELRLDEKCMKSECCICHEMYWKLQHFTYMYRKRLRSLYWCAWTAYGIDFDGEKWKCMKGNFNVERKKALSGSLSIRLGQCLRSWNSYNIKEGTGKRRDPKGSDSVAL